MFFVSILVIYLIFETLNFIYYLYIKSNINKKTYYYGNRIEKSIIKHYKNIPNQTKYLYQFLISHENSSILNAEDIPLKSVIRLLLSMHFNKSLSQANYKNLRTVFHHIYKLKTKSNIKFNNKETIKNNIFMRFGKSSIVSYYKPLFLSIILVIIRIYYEFILKINKFNYYYSNTTNINYWYKINDSSNTPVIFIHGFGIGIIPYLNFILNISKDCTIICPVLPNISNIYFHPLKWNICKNDFFPDLNLIYDEIGNILALHKISKVNIVAHSFGTFILSGLMLNSHLRRKIYKKIYADPVCFLSGTEKVFKSVDRMKKNVIRRHYIISNLKHYIIYYVIYLDIYVKYATKRNLFSMDYLWGNYRYLDSDSIVVLSECDHITPSSDIYTDIIKSGKGKSIIWLENANHGDIFMDKKWNDILKKINNFIIK